MKRNWTLPFVLAACFCLPQTVFAAGFAINEIGARELGMANAVTAVADRPSAIAFNPAGLAQQRGLLFDASLSFVMPVFGYDTNIPSTGEPIRVEGRRDTFLVPSLFVGYRFNERIAAGLGVYSPYGLAVNWDKTVGDGVPWWGRAASEEIDLKTVFINPTLALKLSDRVYLGTGFVIAQAAVTLKRAVTLSNDPVDDVDVDLSGDDLGFGATVGLLVKLVPDRLNFGVSYRSAVKFNFTGAAAFTRGGSADAVPASLRTRLIDSDVEAPLTLPHTVSFGVAAFPLPNLTVSANIDILTWSTYDVLQIDFVDAPELSSAERRDWNNTFALRVGLEYKALGDNLPLRLGLIYDQSPVPDTTVGPDLPDADRFLVAVGLGYVWRGLRFDAGYQLLVTPEQETGPNVAVVGSRDAQAHIVALGLGYGLDI
jgi:long-chain fatty acid transport protein